jgi:ubiquinone/menaquinone biosynthesis C-methylase UbiE
VSGGYGADQVWGAGPERVYDALSAGALAGHRSVLQGRLVLDVGAGTGCTSRALASLGARPLALDASWPMLRRRRAAQLPAVTSDAVALAVGDAVVGATVAAFVLSHVDDHVRLLREAGRVTAGGGAVVAISFDDTGTRAEAQEVVDDVLRDWGWTPPGWYRHLKEVLEPAAADPVRLLATADAAGLEEARTEMLSVDTMITAPHQQVDWRLGAPGAAAFVAAMPAAQREALRAAAVTALGPSPAPLVFGLRVLSSRAAATRRRVSP